MTPQFDAAWRDRALAGDPAAVRALAEEALPPLYAFCLYRVGRNRHLCEEVVQETLLIAIRGLERYDPARAGGDIFGWLAGLARNEIRRVLGREGAAVSLTALWDRMDKELLDVFARLESEPIGAAVLEREETRQMVNAAMAQLPPPYRAALEAKYVDGKSVREIAATMNVTEKAAESQLGRARGAFRATFLALTKNLSVEMV